MKIDIEYLERCIQTLEAAYDLMRQQMPDDMTYDIYRAACVKEFELIEEQSGSLLRKRLRPFFASNRDVDRLTFRDVFRHAARHDLISCESCERWLEYRDLRNDTAHRYGRDYAERTLEILPFFIDDARDLAAIIGGEYDE